MGRGMAAVETTSNGGWLEITLNRPETRNAINGPLGEGLAQALLAADADDDVHAVLLCGAEGAFCSGLDLKQFNAEPEPDWLSRFGQIWRGAHRALFQCRKPVVVALERFAINGGAALALAADLLVVGDGAFLQVGEVRVGMAAPYNMAWLQLRQSEAVIARLTLTGRRFHGPELVQMGVAHESVADAAVLSRARELTAEVAGFPGGAATRIKRLMRGYASADADEWFDRATRNAGGRVAPRAVT